MPEAGTAKAMANRIKAKGLQKLKFFCQMCQKQCRDENGFKCHCMTEGHLRQMALFAQNPDKFMDSFSKEFETSFVELLSRRFGTRRVHANIVYNEYIQDKQHAHMNSTMWTTLTEFIKYLGRTGKCVIDEDPEKGWHITWINRDPEAVRRQQEAAKRKERELDDEARYEAEIEAIAEAAQRAAAEGALPSGDGEDDDSDDEEEEQGGSGAGSGAGAAVSGAATRGKTSHAIDLEKTRAEGAGVKIALGGSSSMPLAGRKRPFSALGDDDDDGPPAHAGQGAKAGAGAGAGAAAAHPAKIGGISLSSGRLMLSGASGTAASSTFGPSFGSSVGGTGIGSSKSSNMSTAGRLLAEDEAEQRRKAAAAAGVAASQVSANKTAPAPSPAPAPASNASEEWLLPGIVVRVMNKSVAGGAHYKAKGAVLKVVDTYGAHVKLQDGGPTLQLDVSDLETTCPAVGGEVLIVSGPYRGALGAVQAIHTDRYCADIQLLQGTGAGQLLRDVDYEAFSRAA